VYGQDLKLKYGKKIQKQTGAEKIIILIGIKKLKMQIVV
jgi:hypothetical protein